MATPYSGNNRLLVAYGLTQALENLSPQPIVAKRAPTTADKAQLGTIWVIPSLGAAYLLVAIANNLATWILLESSGGAGLFSSLTVTPGPTDLEGNFLSNGGTFSVTSGTHAINISADAAATTVNVATGAGAKALTLGSTNTTSATTINAGTGDIGLATAATGTITLGAATMTGTLTVGQSTAGQTIDIGNGVNGGVQTINIASGAYGASSAVNILNGVGTAGTASFDLLSDSGQTQDATINIGRGGSIGGGANTIVIGTTSGASATTIGAGTGAISLTTAATGTIDIGGAAMTGTITVGQSTAGQSIEIGTAAAANNITIGSTTAGTTTLQSAGGTFSVSTLYSGADTGGVATYLGLTPVTDTTQGVGALTLVSTNGNSGTNTGFLKFYIGVQAVYVPYFVTIAP